MTTADTHAPTPDSPAPAGAGGPPLAASAPDTHAGPPADSHDEHAVHTYESGLSEGNARVPMWLATAFLSIQSFVNSAD